RARGSAPWSRSHRSEPSSRAPYSRRSPGASTAPRSARSTLPQSKQRASFEQALFAEQSARPHHQDNQHHQIDHGLTPGRVIGRDDPCSEPDDQADDHGAEQAADTAYDDGNEALHDQAVAHRRREAEHAGGEHTGEPWEDAA